MVSQDQNSTGFVDINLTFGLPANKPVTGDWDGNGADTIGVFLLRKSNERRRRNCLRPRRGRRRAHSGSLGTGSVSLIDF
jgi:hypothetical protein